MKALKRLFRRGDDGGDRGRIDRARRLFADAAARGEVACRLCGIAAGRTVHLFRGGKDQLGAPAGIVRTAFYALCDECQASPDATGRTERLMLDGASTAAPTVIAGLDDDLRRSSLV